MIQGLALLLPLVEAFGASGVAAGSTAAATGTAAGAALAGSAGSAAGTAAAGGAAAGATSGLSGGFSNIINKVMGTVQGFGSAEELGKGVQEAQSIADAIAGLKKSIGGSYDKQDELTAAAKARPGEVDPYTGARGPAKEDTSQSAEHLTALAELQKQRAAMEQEAKTKQASLVDLHARIGQTTNPRSPLESLGQIGGLAAGGGAVGSLLGMFGGGGGGNADRGLAATLAGAPQKAMGPFGSVYGMLSGMIPGGKAPQNIVQAGLQPLTDLGVNQAEGNVIGGAANYASEGLGKAMNPFSVMNGELLTHAAKLPGLLEEWGEGLVESKRHLMQFNGTLAQSFLEAERRGLIRNIESGERTSGATAGLSDALQDLADAVQPIKDAVTVVVARGVEVLVRSVTTGLNILETLYAVAEKVTPGMEAIRKGIEKAGEGGPNKNNIREFLAEVNQRDPTVPRRVPRR